MSTRDAEFIPPTPDLPTPGLQTPGLQTPDPEKVDDSDTEQKISPAPDGGFTAWLHSLLMHIVFFNTWGVANGYGVFQNYYSQTLGVSQASIAWIGSVQVFFLFGIGVVTGRLTDAGYFRITFYTGVFFQVFGLFMTSLCKTYWQIFLAQAVCVGIGNGFAFCPALAVLSQYFKRNRAVAVGIASAGSAVGGLVYPAMINKLVFRHDIGYPWTLRIMGFIVLATYIPCLVFFKPRLPPANISDWFDKSAFSEKPFLLFSLSMFFNFWGLYFAFFFLGTYARDVLHMDKPINLVMILNGVGIVGRVLPTIVADRWTGMLNLVIPLGFIATIISFCWAAVSSVSGLYAFAVIYGLIAAALQSLLPATATTMTDDPTKTGTRVGMILGFVSIANLTGPAICGAIIERQGGSYLGAQMFAATCILMGALTAVATRIAKVGVTLRAKA